MAARTPSKDEAGIFCNQMRRKKNMRKRASSLLALSLAVSFNALGQSLPENGYYRVQNYGTGRYIVVLDNRGSINASTTDADLEALRTYEGFDKVVGNPASVIYAKKLEESGNHGVYDLYSQGTNTYDIVGIHLYLYDNKDGTYRAYYTSSGVTKYLADENYYSDANGEYHLNTSGGPNDVLAKWCTIPLTTEEGAYFGIRPDCTDATGNYAAFYATFPFSFASSGMAAYYVTDLVQAEDGYGMLVWKEIADGQVPTETPVIIKCASTDPAANKINIPGTATTAISDNILGGNIFCNAVNQSGHRNVRDYDPENMRVLGITSEGYLGMIKMDPELYPYIPANNSFIVVHPSAPDELRLVTESECEALKLEHKNPVTEPEPDTPDDPDEGQDDDTGGGSDNPDSGDTGSGSDNPDSGDTGGGSDNPDSGDTGSGSDNPNDPDGIVNVTTGDGGTASRIVVYTMTGLKVSDGNTMPQLPAGMYIMNGKKVVVR